MDQEKWETLERDLFNNLQEYFTDLYQSILKLRLKHEPYNPHARSQLCIAFIAIDTFSRFSEIFEGVRGEELNKDNAKRFKKWVTNYVITERNDVYKTNRDVLRINQYLFWKLRNSLLHFYSFPQSEDGVSLGFVFDFSTDQHKRIEAGMKEKGIKCKFIDSHFLIQAIFTGFTLFMLDLKQQIEDSPEKYIDSVKYAYEIVQKENMKTLLISEDYKLKN